LPPASSRRLRRRSFGGYSPSAKFPTEPDSNPSPWTDPLVDLARYERRFRRAGRDHHGIDILVNNAALATSTRFGDLSADEWRLALEVNVTAPFLLTKAVLPAMKAQRYGRIVNISSSAGKTVSTLGGAHYTTSKAALQGLTRAAAKELGTFGITVNAVCPGMIDTELTHEYASDDLLQRLAAGYPVPRLGTAREVADLVCFAASEAAGYITGASLDINGGDLML
jgi:3-oxoacyl-[acyl-carrier protein] reductase